MVRIAAGLTIVAIAGAAAADPLPPVTDRNYAIELYDGVVVGNSATVAMGGASAANASGTSGTLVNVSAPAVKSTTDTDRWAWDYHFDYLNGALSTDYSNTGLALPSGGTSILTAGLGGRYHDWGAAVTGYAQIAPLDGSKLTVGGVDYDMRAVTTHVKLAIAKWIPEIDTAIGVATNIAQFTVEGTCTAPTCTLFEIQGIGGEVGATWIPRLQNFRVGANLASGIAGGNVIASNCPDLANCEGFILPEKVVSAWRLAAGGAYRFAPSAWNQLVGGNFRDERAVTLVGDVVLAADAPNGFGLEAFGQHELQRSGRHTALSLRGGVEYEWVPGRLRVRGGSYWEPARYADVSGRLHVTFGIEVRVFEFHLFGRRRGRLTLTSDTAPRYRNFGLSVGFWH